MTFPYTDLTRHNWWRKLQALADTGPIDPRVRRVAIRHDETCAIWRGDYCDCDPEVDLQSLERVE